MSNIQKRIEAQKNRIKQSQSYKTFDLHVDLTERFFERISELEITQKELANRAGLKASYLNRVLNNPSNLTLDTIVKISEALELDAKVLLKPKSDKAWIQLSGEIDQVLKHVVQTTVEEAVENHMKSIREKVRWELKREAPDRSAINSTEDDDLPFAA